MKLGGLTLFCCPWFSYSIATTPCCRRLLCSALLLCCLAVREYFHLVLPQSQPSLLYLPWSDTGQKQPRPHACRWDIVVVCAVLRLLTTPGSSASAPRCYFPQQTPLQEVLSKIWWRQRVRWAPCRFPLPASISPSTLKMSNTQQTWAVWFMLLMKNPFPAETVLLVQ